MRKDEAMADDHVPGNVIHYAKQLMEIRSKPRKQWEQQKTFCIIAAAAFLLSLFFPNYKDQTHPEFIKGAALAVLMITGYLWYVWKGEEDRKAEKILRIEEIIKEKGYKVDMFTGSISKL